MKMTLMVCSGDPEVVWNGFRMGNLMLEQMDDALEQHFQSQPALRQQFSNLFVAAPDGRIYVSRGLVCND